MEGRQPIWKIIEQELDLLIRHEKTKWDTTKEILKYFLYGISNEEKDAIERLLEGDVLWECDFISKIRDMKERRCGNGDIVQRKTKG